jgi:4-hydroxyacetophenone monooxygenase
MEKTLSAFRQAVEQAHLPTLAVAVAQASGDLSILADETPVYDFWGDGMGDFSPAFRAHILDAAERVLWPIIAGDAAPAPRPDPAQTRAMMAWIAGGAIPDQYLPFLEEELMLDGADRRAPTALKSTRRAIVIGAGMSGLLAAHRLRQAGAHVTILEANADVGGTWFLNRYPGVRVDTPNHLYSYSFEPNHDWPEFYSQGDVLVAYFQRFAKKHGLYPCTRFNTRATAARWQEDSATWTVETDSGDFEAEILVAAVGQLNEPRYPDIPGVGRFEGPAFHSARWDHSVDLAGKRIAVIGTGASAYQFVPIIAEQAAHLTVFQRTPPWMGPTDNYHDAVPRGFQWAVEHIPAYDKWYRFWLFWMLTDGVLPAVRAEEGWEGPPGTISPANAELRAALVDRIRAQVEARPDLLSAVVPDYPIGGKRSLRDNGVWLAALQRPNVTLETSPIAEITPSGPRTADGRDHPADVLIYGTGFHASDFLKSLAVIGRGGADLHARWAGDARAWLGLMVPDFPNFFMIYGPNTNIVVNGSIIFLSECGVRFVTEAVRLLEDSGAQAIDVREDRFRALNDAIDAENARMAWGQPGVSSWYKNRHGRVSQNWPFPLVDYWQRTRNLDPADYQLTPSPVRAAAE